MPADHLLTSSWYFANGCGRRCPALLTMLAAGALGSVPISVNAAVLWERPESTRVRNHSMEILHDALAPRDDSARETLYFKLRIKPLSDVLIKTQTGRSYQAGLVFSQEGRQKLGIGNAWFAWSYSAYCKSFQFAGNKPGELTLCTDNPEVGADGEYPRIDQPVTLVVKVEYLPSEPDSVTVWLDPDLGVGATEAGQSGKNVTRFKADVSFDQIRLMHRGEGQGWVFDDIAAATSFHDFVAKPLWLRPWFIAVAGSTLVLTMLGGVIVLERRRSRRRVALLEREQAIAAERVRIAQDLHDELGAKLTEVVLLGEVAAKLGGAEQTSVSEMLQALRELHTSLDEAVWSINPRNDSLVSLIEYMSDFSQRFVRHAPVTFHLEVSDDLPEVHLSATERHNLLLAVKESLNNAVRHAHATEIRLRVEKCVGGVRIAVCDEGCGFDISGQSSGDGLRNMRARLESIGGNADIRSELGKGTEVLFELPLPSQRRNPEHG